MNKTYNASPLPFMGQKRRFAGEFRKALHSFPNATIFVDLFGGSGLLSHITKRELPNARVIYNDYDNFHLRIKNIDKTNTIISEIRSLLSAAPRGKKVSEELKAKVLRLLEEYDNKGYVDYVTISSSILFSSNYATSFAELKKATLYNTVKLNPYSCEGYIDGLEVVKCDYKELFEKYKDVPGVVFLVDPPYLSTEVGVYKCYWRLRNYLDVLKVINKHSYIYFTSSKSSIIELIEWMESNTIDGNPFNGATRKEFNVTMNHQSKYTDIMLYRT